MTPQPLSPPGSLATGELDLRAIVGVLLRRRWIGVGALVVSLIGGVIVTVRAPRIYQATARVLIEKHAPQVLSADVREVYDLGTQGYWAAQEYYATQYRIIQSGSVAQKVVELLGISGPALASALRALPEESLEARVAVDPLSEIPPPLQDKLRLVGLDGLRDRKAMIEALENLNAGAFVLGRISVEPVRDTQLADITVTDTDPKRAALLANTVTDAYMEVNLDQKIEFTRSAVDWRSDQVTELKARLRDSELAFYQFRKDNNVISVSLEDRQSMVSQTLSDLNRSLSEVRAHRLAVESRRAQLQRAHAAGMAPDMLAEALENPLIQQLKAAYSTLGQEEAELSLRYTESHPKLIAVRRKMDLVSKNLQAEIDKMLGSVDEQYATLRDNERRLREAVEEVTTEALELNRKEIDYNRLKREVDNNRELYDLVLKRQKEADLTQMLKVNNVRRLEAAVAPSAPISPRVRVNMLLALAVGLLLGIGLAFIVDLLDNTVKIQEQVETVLGLPFLGIVPTIRATKGQGGLALGDRDRFILLHPHSSVAECCRTIRTNLMFMSPDDPLAALLVTSSGPQEGKSTTVVNLAITMAQSGKRTLLIDTDMRRPRLHHTFGVANEVGVSNVILGEAPLERALQSSSVANLDLLTCGPIPPNPAELLHTESFQAVLAQLRQRYDRLLFDSPPVGVLSDALVLGTMVDGVVLVVHAGKTSLPAAAQARRRVEDVGGRIVGAVLNNVDLDDRRTGQYYQYYYYHQSSYGEEATSRL